MVDPLALHGLILLGFHPRMATQQEISFKSGITCLQDLLNVVTTRSAEHGGGIIIMLQKVCTNRLLAKQWVWNSHNLAYF